MTKTTLALASALLLGLTVSVGTAFAGDGKSCGGKKKDGDTAAVVVPAKPLA
jgi:hypothetical protein